MPNHVPDPAIRRLSAYLRKLEVLAETGVEHVSSNGLAAFMNVGAAQVRRDLTLFGHFGRPGVGYEVADLIQTIRVILGTQRQWPTVLIGAGELGRVLMRYPGFRPRGFEIVAAFDSDPAKAYTKVDAVPIYPMRELENVLGRIEIRLAILAVPPSSAQALADRLAGLGVRGILNFAGAALEPPDDTFVSHVDITAHLEELSFHVNSEES